jgi:hypothetical protein
MALSSVLRFHHPHASAIAADYIGRAKELELLGWGVDGVVFTTPGSMNAFKVYKQREGFVKELGAYRRLQSRGISEFMGFRVPRLIKFEDDGAAKMIIEMSVVKPPCLLDFAAATVDHRPDWAPEQVDMWWAQVEENFGDDFAMARDVFWALQRELGIHYWDLKPTNLQFRTPPRPATPPPEDAFGV